METVANMAGGLAHDSNNQRTALEIGEAASVAASITSQLLVPSRRSEVRFEVLNVDEVVAEMQPILSRSIDKIRTVTTDLNSSAGPVRCDRNPPLPPGTVCADPGDRRWFGYGQGPTGRDF